MHSRAKREVMSKMTKKKSGNWIKNAINPDNKGTLHKTLGVPEGKKNPTKKRANLAGILRSFKSNNRGV